MAVHVVRRVHVRFHERDAGHARIAGDEIEDRHPAAAGTDLEEMHKKAKGKRKKAK